MKTGRTLVELATEIERQRANRVDYVAPSQKLKVVVDPSQGSDVAIKGLARGALTTLNDLAHRQVGDWAKVPAAYYDRMRKEAPALLADNLNHWLTETPSPRLVRVLDGRVRAWLSDSYRPLENADLAEAVLPALQELAVEVISCEITERRLYIKAVDRQVVREIEGRRIVEGRSVDFDHVSPVVTISNSEVGHGALVVDVGMYTHECRNMALFREKSLRKYHAGARLGVDEALVKVLSDRTRALTDAAVWSQVQDVVRNALAPDAFEKALIPVQQMTQDRIAPKADVVKVVDLASRHLGLTEAERPSVLQQLIQGGSLTRYGLFNAVTRIAEDSENYDRATELERIGGEVIELAPSEWKRIAEAA